MVLDLTPSYVAATSDVTTCSVSVVGANWEAGLISFLHFNIIYLLTYCCNLCDNMLSFSGRR